MTSTSSGNMSIRQFTDLVFEDQIKSSVRSAKSEISEILRSLRDKTAIFTYKGQIVTAVPADFPRLLAEWGTKTKVQQSVRNIVTSSLFSAEEKCAGSALLGAGFWISGEQVTISSKKRCTQTELESCLKYLGGLS